MKRKHLSIVAAGLVSLFAACSDNSVEAGDQSVDTQAKLRALVLDNSTLYPIAGAKASLLSGGSQQTTDEQGIAVISDVTAGYHKLRAEAVNYATAIVDIEKENAASSVFVTGESIAPILLLPLNANLQGTVRHGSKLVNSAKLQLVLETDELEKTVYEVDVVNGAFEIKGLPAGYSGKIRYLVIIGDKLYDGGSHTKALSSGFNSSAVSTGDEVNFYVTGYTNELVTLAEDLVFKFSEAADVKFGSITVTSDFISFDRNWSEDGKTLTLKLFEGSKWDSSFTVTLGSFQSKVKKSNGSGSELPVDAFKVAIKKTPIPFGAVEGLAPRAGATITADATVPDGTYFTSRLVWTYSKDPDVSYNVYAKASKGSKEFALVAQCPKQNTTLATSSPSNCAAALNGIDNLGLISENDGEPYYSTAASNKTHCGYLSSKGFDDVDGDGNAERWPYSDINCYSNNGTYCTDIGNYWQPRIETSKVYNQAGTEINRYSAYVCTASDVSYATNGCSSVGEKIVTASDLCTSNSCPNAVIKASDISSNYDDFYLMPPYEYENAALFDVSLNVTKAGTKGWFTTYCVDKEYGQVQDKKTAPFAGGGNIEIVVQAVRGMDMIPTKLSEAAAGSKTTLTVMP